MSASPGIRAPVDVPAQIHEAMLMHSRLCIPRRPVGFSPPIRMDGFEWPTALPMRNAPGRRTPLIRRNIFVLCNMLNRKAGT